MIDSSNLHGVLPAIPTPVTAEDHIDVVATRHLVENLINQGVTGLVPLGGTGEYGSLSRQDRIRMAEITVQASKGRVPVIPGVLDPGYYDAMQAANEFAAVGADAVMLLTPYYTRPTQDGIRDYYLRFADESPLPVLIYEIPYRTQVSISPDMLHVLSRHERIIGMKACNTDMYHFLRTIAGVDDSFAVLSGEDTLFPLHLVAGARGGIVVTASVLPRPWLDMYAKLRDGKLDEALALHRSLMPLLSLAFSETNPGPLKSVMDLVGVDAPHVLRPLTSPESSLEAKLRVELQAQLDAFGGRAKA